MVLEVRKSSYSEASADPDFEVLVTAYAIESSIAGLPTPKGNMDSYIALENAGLMYSYCAYLDDKMIGFANALVVVMPHYGEKIATMESWFVAEEFRYTGVGLQLKKQIEATVKEAGAVGILVSTPVDSTLALVMERQKSYVESHRVFFKALA